MYKKAPPPSYEDMFGCLSGGNTTVDKEGLGSDPLRLGWGNKLDDRDNVLDISQTVGNTQRRKQRRRLLCLLSVEEWCVNWA